jgi:serine/threonine-protein kinase HipA
MTLNGKRDDFALVDFKTCAKAASMKRGRADTILAEVQDTVSRWPDYADEAGVNPMQRDQIHHALRLGDF